MDCLAIFSSIPLRQEVSYNNNHLLRNSNSTGPVLRAMTYPHFLYIQTKKGEGMFVFKINIYYHVTSIFRNHHKNEHIKYNTIVIVKKIEIEPQILNILVPFSILSPKST